MYTPRAITSQPLLLHLSARTHTCIYYAYIQTYTSHKDTYKPQTSPGPQAAPTWISNAAAPWLR